MVIIAESGSTKTDWVVLEKKKVLIRFSTTGFNPNYFPASVLEKGIRDLLPLLPPTDMFKIFFYGSGCSTMHAKKIVTETLTGFFPGAYVEIQHDLFGAARALFGNGQGIASILGTGSSSCLFKNSEITEAVPSLGYLLADEGSGTHLGNLLLNAFLKNNLPTDLKEKFDEVYKISLDQFIPYLYSLEKPNAYIASFTPFVIEHQNHPFIKEIVKKAFRIFFEENILRYPDYLSYELGFVGSVGFLLKEHLQEVADEYKMKIVKTTKNPMEELIAFHSGVDQR